MGPVQTVLLLYFHADFIHRRSPNEIEKFHARPVSAAAVKRIVLFQPQSIAGERVWLTERGAELFA
jgi:hypothetical protein